MALRRLTHWAFRIVVVIALAIALAGDTRYVTLAVGMYVGVMLASIVVHELGHALASWLVGYRVMRIVSGAGPRLVSGRLAGADFEIRLFPVGGHTLMAARTPTDQAGVRWRELIATAGGPAATLALALAAPMFIPADIGVWSNVDGSTAGIGLAEAFTRLGWWLLIVNLLPINAATDGASMLRLLRLDDRGVAEIGEMRGTAAAIHHMQQGDIHAAIDASASFGDNTAAAAMHAATLSMAGRWAEARAILVPLLDEPLPPERQLVVANNLAWVDVNLGDRDLVAEADRWSQVALQLDPGRNPAVVSTRAHVLDALGRHEEAATLFVEALGGALSDDSRATVLAGSARNRLHRGDRLGARLDMDRAIVVHADAPGVQAALEMVDRASLDVVVDQITVIGNDVRIPEALYERRARATLDGAGRALARLGGSATEMESVLGPVAGRHGLTLPLLVVLLTGAVDPRAQSGGVSKQSSIHEMS